MSTLVIGAAASHTTLMNTKWDEVDHLLDRKSVV